MNRNCAQKITSHAVLAFLDPREEARSAVGCLAAHHGRPICLGGQVALLTETGTRTALSDRWPACQNRRASSTPPVVPIKPPGLEAILPQRYIATRTLPTLRSTKLTRDGGHTAAAAHHRSRPAVTRCISAPPPVRQPRPPIPVRVRPAAASPSPARFGSTPRRSSSVY